MMDVLEQIRMFTNENPTAEARSRLFAEIELDDRIDAEKRRALERQSEQTKARVINAERPFLGRRRLSRRLVGGAGLAMAVAAAIVAVALSGGGSVGSASAASILNQAAVNAKLHGLAGPIPGGEYFYQRFVETQGKNNVTHETWISPTGSGRMHTYSQTTRGVTINAIFPTPFYTPSVSNIQFFPAHGIWQGYGVGSRVLTYKQMLRLPSDPGALLLLLARNPAHAGQSPQQEEFDSASQLLLQPALPARLRAGLYRAIAQIKDVRVAGETTIHGDSGVIIGQSSNGLLSEIIVNPDTGLALATRQVTNRSISAGDSDSGAAQQPGTVTYSSVIIASGLVGSTTTRAR